MGPRVGPRQGQFRRPQDRCALVPPGVSLKRSATVQPAERRGRVNVSSRANNRDQGGVVAVGVADNGRSFCNVRTAARARRFSSTPDISPICLLSPSTVRALDTAPLAFPGIGSCSPGSSRIIAIDLLLPCSGANAACPRRLAGRLTRAAGVATAALINLGLGYDSPGRAGPGRAFQTIATSGVSPHFLSLCRWVAEGERTFAVSKCLRLCSRRSSSAHPKGGEVLSVCA